MNNQITKSHIQLVNNKTMFNLLGNQGRETEAMSIPSTCQTIREYKNDAECHVLVSKENTKHQQPGKFY